MEYSAALVGCGKIGSQYSEDPLIKGIHSHAAAYNAHPLTTLVAVCDPDLPQATLCAEKWSVPYVYSDIDVLLNERRPQLVSVCSPDNTHYEILKKVIQFSSVKAIYAEKPLAMSYREALYLASLAKKTGVVLAVNYFRRNAKGIQNLRQKLCAGIIGDVRSISGFYTKGVLHNGTHWFDWARYFVGEVAAVWATEAYGRDDADPTLDVHLRFSNGVTGYLHGLKHQEYSLFELDVLGSQGRMRIYDSGHRVTIFKRGDSPYYSGYSTLLEVSDEPCDMRDTLLEGLKNLLECVKTGEKPSCSDSDGLAAIQIAEAAMMAAKSGKVITLNQD